MITNGGAARGVGNTLAEQISVQLVVETEAMDRYVLAAGRILARRVSAVASLVLGDPKDAAQARQAQMESERSTDRTRVAARLMLVEQAFTSNSDPAAVRSQIQELVASLAPETALLAVGKPAFTTVPPSRTASPARDQQHSHRRIRHIPAGPRRHDDHALVVKASRREPFSCMSVRSSGA